MAGPQHRTPEYVAYRNYLRLQQRAGITLRCVEPVCVEPSRDIKPWMKVHVCHDPSGIAIIGPGHQKCNITEVNERRMGKRPKRVAL